MRHTALGPGIEFDHIRALLDVWGPLAHDIGDDAAVVNLPPGQQLVVSTDATVDGVHFRRDWMSVTDIGARGATAALSDLAAMGAAAHSLLVSLVVPDSWAPHLGEFAAGVGRSVSRAGGHIVGGNISRGQTFSATFTAMGFAASPVRRTGASPGDVLYVTGTLGGPKHALDALGQGRPPEPRALDRFLHPTARIDEGQWLAANGVHAMIDISDGLGADARHLSAANGLVAWLDPASIPRFDFVTPEEALASGEEYELLVAVDDEHTASFSAGFERRFSLPLTRVGYLAQAGSEAETHAISGFRVELPGGHDHFSK